MKQLPPDALFALGGAPRPLCLDVAGPAEVPLVRYVLKQSFALLGRYRGVDVPLLHADVSRRHALLIRIAGRLFCLDLGSRTGTDWDGADDGRGWVTPGSPLQLGPFRVASTEPDEHDVPDWDPTERGSLEPNGLAGGTLEIANQGRPVCAWRMNRMLAIVGSAPSCKVHLVGPQVSRCHCALVCTQAGLWVLDLRRQQGVIINGTPVSQALLDDGDELEIGSFTIRLRYDDAPAPEPPGQAEAANGLMRLNGTYVPETGATNLLAPTNGTGSALSNASDSAELLPQLFRQFGEMQQQMFDQTLLSMFQMLRSVHGEQIDGLREQLARMDELNRELQTLLTEKTAPRPTVSVQPAPRSEAKSLPAPTVPTTHANAPRPAAPAAPAVPPAPAAETPDLHVWLAQRMATIHDERQGLWQRIVGSLRKSD